MIKSIYMIKYICLIQGYLKTGLYMIKNRFLYDKKTGLHLFKIGLYTIKNRSMYV